MKNIFILFSLAFLLCACNDYKSTDVRLPDGFTIHARIADTPQKTEKGLMFVEKLPKNEGMIFVFDKSDTHYFWMKNTWVDLDIIFLSEDKKITQMYEGVPRTYTYTPENEIPYVKGDGMYVLEAASGTITRQGLQSGDPLQFDLWRKNTRF